MTSRPAEDWKYFWGKARPTEGSAVDWHPLWMHSLDVAAVGKYLATPYQALFTRIQEWTRWRPDETTDLFVFLLAIHDLGKFTRVFQIKAEGHWPEQVLGPIDAPTRQTKDPGHPLTGLLLLRECLQPAISRWFPAWDCQDIERILGAVLGHHGRPVGLERSSLLAAECRSTEKAAARAYVEALEKLLPPPALAPPEPDAAAKVSWVFAGLAVLADWIGSNQRWFPYQALGPTIDEYWHGQSLPRARSAILEAGLSAVPANPRTGFASLTKLPFMPAPTQAWAESVDLPDGPLLILIEDMTGGGKTEAALVLAHRLIAVGRARGLYAGLPTMATANAMYGRFGEIYKRIYAPDSHPTLCLTHGHAGLNSDFFASVLPVDAGAPMARGKRSDSTDDGDSAAESTAWLASESRKALLADVGVGTIDQALLGVLPAKFQSLRLIGLAEKVLIVDEAHAYDSYMGRELDRLVAFQAALGSHTIILSATLPTATKIRLKNEWAKATGVKTPDLTKHNYPLTTLLSTKCTPQEEAHKPRSDLPRTIQIMRLGSVEDAAKAVTNAVWAGAAVAWIRNTVDDVIDAANLLTAIGLSPTIFHARFAMGDRIKIENEIVARFGRDGAAETRGGIVVASQVIQESLDLDFDLIVSDLAPIDLLMQRAGRLWRHLLLRPAVSRPVAGPCLAVLSPDPNGAIDKNWYKAMFPRASAVYDDPLLLWRTAAAIFERGRIHLPKDLRALIEAVYRLESEDNPQALCKDHELAQARHCGERSFADANLLKVLTGYEKDSQPWVHESKVSTRLVDETRVLRLARWDGAALMPWYKAETASLAWAMSEVMVRQHKIAALTETSPALAAQIAEATASWGRYDAEKLLIPLESVDDGQWETTIWVRNNEEKTLCYIPGTGLIFR